MAHPTDVKRLKGKLWHKEDSGLSLLDARALKRHLKKTEEKQARIFTDSKKPGKHEVWWTK
jgi:hypothetical protein